MDFPPELIQTIGTSSPMALIALWVGFNLREMTRSINALNVNVAAILERTSGHERRLEEHSDRIQRLENH